MILGILLNFLCFSKEISTVITDAKECISELTIFWEDNRSIIKCQKFVEACRFHAELPRDLSPLWRMWERKTVSHKR